MTLHPRLHLPGTYEASGQMHASAPSTFCTSPHIDSSLASSGRMGPLFPSPSAAPPSAWLRDHHKSSRPATVLLDARLSSLSTLMKSSWRRSTCGGFALIEAQRRWSAAAADPSRKLWTKLAPVGAPLRPGLQPIPADAAYGTQAIAAVWGWPYNPCTRQRRTPRKATAAPLPI